MNGQYREGDIVFGSWKLVRKIGEGSFGKVYEAEREDFGELYKAAIKIISIPKDSAEIENARAEGMDDKSITESLKSVAKDISKEFALMSKLKGTSHVVSYEDHCVVAHDSGFGWNIMLRMELLTPLKKQMTEGRLSDKEIVKLGIDMCKALELCRKFDIIHRDIKPENIFVSELGDYKLGDFGIARKLDGTSGFMTQTGTYSYMAPEIVRREKYGPAVDIYSLGLVLYTLLNNNRGVFLPAYPAPIMKSDREEAFERRMSGEKLPAPINAEGGLAEIVLKACAFKPEDRYASPTEMREALEAWLNRGVVKPIIDDDDDKTVIEPKVEIKPVEENKTEIIKEQKTEQKPEEKSEVVLDKKYFENLINTELQNELDKKKPKKAADYKKIGEGEVKKASVQIIIIGIILFAVLLIAAIGIGNKSDADVGRKPTYEYYSDGSVSAKIEYDADGLYTKTNYNADKTVKSIEIYNANDKLLKQTEYENNKETNTFVYTYDDMGRPTSGKAYSEGKLYEWVEAKYHANGESERVFYDCNDLKNRVVVYYDANGNKIGEESSQTKG